MMTTATQRLKQTQSSSDYNRPTTVLSSVNDDYLLSQDICTLCGSIGKGDEGNLISCSQCGQCYHPYCVGIKSLKVVISKGWRCLECTVCESCGQPGDEGKLLLCDECELSFHTYCLDPPLEDVPQGAWKCHWCVINNPHPIKRPASPQKLDSNEPKESPITNGLTKDSETNYPEGSTTDENKKPPTETTDDLLQSLHLVDGVYLSDVGFNYMKAQKLEPAKRQRAKRGPKIQKLDDSNIVEDNNKNDDDDGKRLIDEKDEDGKRKRIRKLGIGGFSIRQRGVRLNKDDDFLVGTIKDETSTPPPPPPPQSNHFGNSSDGSKPKRIRKRPKKKSNLSDQYPSYLQEAFFGTPILSNTELKFNDDCSDLDLETNDLNIDSKKKPSEELPEEQPTEKAKDVISPMKGDLMDVLIGDAQAVDEESADNKRENFDPDLLSSDFNLDNIDPLDSKDVEDLLNDLGGQQPTLPPPMPDQTVVSNQSRTMSPAVRPLIESHFENSPQTMMPAQIPSPHVQFRPPPPQHPQMLSGSNMRPINRVPIPDNMPNTPRHQQPEFVDPAMMRMQPPSHQYQPMTQPQQQPQPHFSQQIQQTEAQKASQNWESEEALGDRATKSAVLYANTKHPNLKLEFRSPDERFKQIQKLWRQLPSDERKYFVEKARENRSAAKVSKPVCDTSSVIKKDEIPMQHQVRPHMQHEGMHMPSPHMQPPMIPPHQDRWRQPVPMDGPPPNRFMPSPHPPHMSMDPNLPPQSMSPSVRPMTDSGVHFEHSPQHMMPPQTPSPQTQFARPSPHSGIQVSRVKPPPIDANRIQGSDPYAMPPSTPRPVPIPQRSPYSPQSPYPQHPIGVATSTPPVKPRTPNEHQAYGANQPMGQSPFSMPQQQPSSFIEQETHISPQQSQLPNQYHQMRQPQYNNQPQRMVSPMQYGNQMSGSPIIRSPNNRPPHMQPQGQPQQAGIYQPGQQYRPNQPVRFVNHHQDRTNSPMQQQTMVPQQINSPRPMVNRQQVHPQQMGPRMPNQPRMQHQIVQAPPQMNQPMPQQQPPQHIQSHPPQHQHQHQHPHQHQHQQQHHIHQQQQTLSHSPMMSQQQQPSMPPQQHQTQAIATPQPIQHHNVAHQQQPQHMPQQAPSQHQQSHNAPTMNYNNIQNNFRLDPDDPVPLLEDEDALKDLGADFNILEFADPEPDKGASTSSGKNNIDLDPEFEDFFSDKDTLDEKRPVESLPALGHQHQNQQVPQQQQQPQQQQTMYQPIHQQTHQQMHTPNQGFVDRQQQQMNIVQHPQQQPIPQSNQYQGQRMQFVDHQRGATPVNQQYAPNQQTLVRAPQQMQTQMQVSPQMRMQHPQQNHSHPHHHQHHHHQPPQQQSPQQILSQHQNQVGYVQNRPQQPVARYQSPMSHDITHQQPQQSQGVVQPQQQINSPQMQRMQQMPPQHQYQQQQPQQQGYIDHQQQVGHMHQHHHHHQQQPQQFNQTQQQNVMYSGPPHQQMNQPRSQFQPPMHQPPPQQQQQGYTYHQQQQQQPHQMVGGYQSMVNPQQQMMKPNNEQQFVMHDKSPIIGESLTSMEFTMYEQGSGANNEAINLPMQTSESQHSLSGSNQENDQLDSEMVTSNLAQTDQGQSSADTEHELELNSQVLHEHLVMSNDDQSSILPHSNQQITLDAQPKNSDLDLGSSRSAANRLSSCSQESEIGVNPGPSTSSATGERHSSGSQAQNQLLKQLLATCSSADSPSQETSSTQEPIQKVPPIHPIVPKPASSNIPTISFQIDSSTKPSVGPIIANQPQVSSGQQPVRPTNIIGPVFQQRPSITTSVPRPSPSFEIKTFNSGPQIPSAPIVRVQQLPAQVSSAPMVQIHSEGQIISKSEPYCIQPQQQNPRIMETKPPSQTILLPAPIGTTDPDLGPSRSAINQETNSGGSATAPKTNETQMSSKAKRKSDYMAKRRADLEKDPTPPPREVKPKKRVRGPNKRSRVENTDDSKTFDSNSNTSETSNQLPDAVQTAPPRKRVRKSKANISDDGESLLSSLASKIHNELPMLPVREPDVQCNNNACSLFACGNLNSTSCSKLRGHYGKAIPAYISPLMVANLHTPASTKRGRQKMIGYYHEEFPIDLDDSIDISNHSLLPERERDCESPCSIISCSSVEPDETADIDGSDTIDASSKLYTPKLNKFNLNNKHHPINENSHTITDGQDQANMDINNNNSNERILSPSIPIDIKLPTAHVSISDLSILDTHESDDHNKENRENIGQPQQQQQEPASSSIPEAQNVSHTANQTSTSLSMRLKDRNVSVTLTLTNEEADNVKRMLNKLSQMIEQPTAESSTTSTSDNAERQAYSTLEDDKTSLSNSIRLLTTGSANENNSLLCNSGHSDLRFNELNFEPMKVDEDHGPSASAASGSTSTDQLDVKPELCYQCKAIVVDRGIRKAASEIPEFRKRPNGDLNGELIFCSVNCYAAIVSSSATSQNLSASVTSDSKAHLSQMMPPISPMMEDDDNDDSPDGVDTLNVHTNTQTKKWDEGSGYDQWKSTQLESTKSTSPINSDDLRDTPMNECSSQGSSLQLLNQGDSSVDSNESDNSTFYSQSTSNRQATNLDESTFNLSQQTSANRYTGLRDLDPDRYVLTSWPEDLDTIRVEPIKSIHRKSAGQQADDNLQDISQQHPQPLESDIKGLNKQGNEMVLEMYRDTRKCVLCHEFGDGDSDGPARLLNLYVDGWVHLNCALWSLDVYELENGALINVELALRKAMVCSLCHKTGATLKCFKPRCPKYYHLMCAIKDGCTLYLDKSVQCRQHAKSNAPELPSLVVKRRVYVNRDEEKQVAEMIQLEQRSVMRIGSLVFLNIGQLLPHQLNAFHDQNNIFPVGYRIIRYYWSYRRFNKRCKYVCTIEDSDNKPQFRVSVQEHGYDVEQFVGNSPQAVWDSIIERIVKLREQVPDTITTFPAYIRGSDLFGLNEPSIVRILESLPGVETLTDYDFKFGRSPLLELPLAINPTGCARTEPKLRTHLKRPYTIHTTNLPKSRSLQSLGGSGVDSTSSPYIKQFVHSKSSQYRKMKSEWRNNVVLARSRVQGLGLYAARDIEKHTMVIEYIGMLIRNEIAERYEKIHEANNRGIYMFRLDEDRVIDATLAGGLARYINHSCNPNCVAEAVEIDRERKILIIANRKILKGEELGYDYKLAIEDDQHKISCLCGAPTCKKWMN